MIWFFIKFRCKNETCFSGISVHDVYGVGWGKEPTLRKRVVLGGRVKGISNLRCKLELVPIGQNKPIPTEDFGMVHIGYHSNGKRRPVLRNKRRIHSPLKDRRGIIWSFFFARVWPIQLEGSVLNTEHKEFKENGLVCTGRGGKSKTNNRQRRVEMHFPRPEVRIYSRKQRPTTKQKSKERSRGPNTNKHTTIATCEGGNSRSSLTAK